MDYRHILHGVPAAILLLRPDEQSLLAAI